MRVECVAAMLLLGASASAAQAQVSRPPIDRIAAAVAEAAPRFGLPQAWILAVMRRESGADQRATSMKGAMGLMQLMPDTWATLRLELGLGADPYDVHDNIVAGAAYLRQLYDQFGPDGFLAAYNAGPRRYLDFITRGRPLPGETRAYVAGVTRLLAGPLLGRAPHGNEPAARRPVPPPPMFVRLDAAFPQRPAASSGLFAVVVGK